MEAERGGWEPLSLYFISPIRQVRERGGGGGEGRVKPPQSLNICVFNVHGYSTNEVKKGEIGKMFRRWSVDV